MTAALERRRVGGSLGDVEGPRVDFKEEAGRRNRDGSIGRGEPHNILAAKHLADEVACMANTPGGGALVVGFDDRTGEVIGASLDADWLRHRVHERVDIAPAVEVAEVDGERILVLYVAESREPVEDTDNRIRWRVGSHCVPVDRSEWWLHQRRRRGADAMAVPTTRTLADAAPQALLTARRLLARGVAPVEGIDLVAASDEELLRYLGVLPPGGHLTQAGALLFCPSPVGFISYSVLTAEGGDVLSQGPDLRGRSLLEQIDEIETRLDAVNTAITIHGNFSEPSVRRLPPRAVREAVLNGLAHRDWNTDDATRVTWVSVDDVLEVSSPSGFVGGVPAENILAEHYARYPALGDVLRALGLVDKRGIGVDRMYREMISLGHRPPTITQTPGPRVRVRLRGGQPVLPVLQLVSAIQPSARREDVKVALVLHALLYRPFVSSQDMSPILQRDLSYAAEAIEATAAARVSGQPLLRGYKGVWLLSPAALAIVESFPRVQTADDAFLAYRRPTDEARMSDVAGAWLSLHGRITSGDYGLMTGLTVAGGRGQLERLVEAGFVRRGPGAGRSAHYLLA